MKKIMGLSWYLGVVGFMVLVSTASSMHGMTCQQALTELIPCRPFLTGMAPSPTAPCCAAVSNVKDAANTTEARRDLCECFEKNAPAYGVKPKKAKLLPGLCGITVPLPIHPSVNCKNINWAKEMH